MADTSDFLQADDINKVILVPLAVAQGIVTDDAIESYIGTNSEGRQGRYYRLAAEKFGLIINSDNHSSLTHNGRTFVSLPAPQRIIFLANQMQSMPVFSDAIIYLQCTPAHQRNLRNWFLLQYPGSPITAERRFSTFHKYMSVAGFI